MMVNLASQSVIRQDSRDFPQEPEPEIPVLERMSAALPLYKPLPAQPRANLLPEPPKFNPLPEPAFPERKKKGIPEEKPSNERSSGRKSQPKKRPNPFEELLSEAQQQRRVVSGGDIDEDMAYVEKYLLEEETKPKSSKKPSTNVNYFIFFF